MLVVQSALHSRHVEDCSDARVPPLGDPGHAIDRSRLAVPDIKARIAGELLSVLCIAGSVPVIG